MRRKGKIILSAYALAAAAVLTGLSWTGQAGLNDYRAAARYSAGQAFEETVRAVEALSESLAKSRYAGDGSMCSRVCCEACANAGAAESAMASLPFDTQELEQLSAFLNVAGDYAYTLCAQAAEQGFTETQREELNRLSGQAADFAQRLRETQGDLNDGTVRYDSREKRLRNVGEEPGEALSARLLGFEKDFEPGEPLRYDGRYGCEKRQKLGYLTEEEMLQTAADFAGRPPEELSLLYRYEGIDGQRCYRTGDLFLCVSRCGVESMAQSRLVSEALISGEEAREIAEAFLEQHGFSELELQNSEERGNLCRFFYAKTQEGAVCLDNGIRLAIALDDGSVYSFSAEDYCEDPAELSWNVTEEEAAEKLVEGLSLESGRRVILKSPGERDQACYEFRCLDREGRSVRIYVDAATGKQCEIAL